MSTVAWRFLEPLDVLFLRGNKLFGDPGSFGESLVPPWPSVAAGALRSRVLAEYGTDLAAFASGRVAHPVLGTPDEPGPFTLTAFHLARRRSPHAAEALYPLPADLLVTAPNEDNRSVHALLPRELASALASSATLPRLPVLAAGTREKPEQGFWLSREGWARYLRGEVPLPEELVDSGTLWRIDPRVGVGLDAATGRASDGRLFSVQAVAMAKDVGFLAGVAGAEVPANGTVHLGGDGRAAALAAVTADLPLPDYRAIVDAGRSRLVLTSPGLFAGGWLPTGCVRAETGEVRFRLGGMSGRLVCAAVPRAQVVSGWDLARWRPKSAYRAAPTGSVYWLEDLKASEEDLRKLAETGLWGEPCEDPARRAEGFNRVALAAWT
jgi:CRISPR-associated protein Cmr3